MTAFKTLLTVSLPTLVVDSNGDAANQLAKQLSHSGFRAEVATSCHAAHAAVHARRYGALVVVTDLSLAVDLECLTSLHTQAAGTWIIVISSRSLPNAQRVVFECGADSLLIAPFSLEELAFRLWTFSRRSRP